MRIEPSVCRADAALNRHARLAFTTAAIANLTATASPRGKNRSEDPFFQHVAYVY
jgi:hypothetical protein